MFYLIQKFKLNNHLYIGKFQSFKDGRLTLLDKQNVSYYNTSRRSENMFKFRFIVSCLSVDNIPP